jgi:hypothetical protein
MMSPLRANFIRTIAAQAMAEIASIPTDELDDIRRDLEAWDPLGESCGVTQAVIEAELAARWLRDHGDRP